MIFSPLSRCIRIGKKKGFAIIATLTLLLLLSMICVGLLGLAASQNRTAAAAILAAEARSQALLGLDAALAELQLALGPDQRVSASSGIIANTSNANILGVWDSWDASLTDTSPTHRCKIQSTYTKGRDKMFRRWLISAVDRSDVDKLSDIGTLGMRKPGKRICLVGEGTLGRSITQQQYIFADMIDMPLSGNNIGNYAWWIGGENQKAKVNIETPETSNNVMEVQRRTWDTPAPIVSHIRGLENISTKSIYLSPKSLILSRRVSADAGQPYFFDVTTTSQSLPVNVRSGGFKHDINLLLNKDSLRNTEFARLPQSDSPIFNEKTIPQGTESNMPIGSWQIMHAWYHVWPGGGSSAVTDELSVSLQGTPGNAYTRMGGYKNNVEGNESVFDNKTDLETGGNRAGYPRTPVILAYYNTFGLFTEEWQTTNTDTFYRLSMSFAPMFLWWNPYNVPMRIKGDRLYSQSLPYKTMWLQSYAITTANTWNYAWSVYALDPYSFDKSEGGGTDISSYGKDYGNYFRMSQNDSAADIVFEPGEILFFSPAKARSNNEYGMQAQTPWTLGYHPEAVSRYNAHFYRNSNERYGSSASNIKVGSFYVQLRLGITGEGNYKGPTNGYHFAPNHSECFTLLDGYGSTTIVSEESRGKQLQSPQRFLLGWYNPDAPPSSTVFARGATDGAVWQVTPIQMSTDLPYFIAAVGIAPKSMATELDQYMLTGTDYRTKSWQHSSPAFWGSMIVDPDDQTRRYHPYQLSLLPVGTAFSACPLDSVGPDGRNGILGISSTLGGEEISFASVLELPIHPPFSLAGFAGMRITPGWFDTGTDKLSILRRQQYQSGVQGVGIGNSFADPCIPAGEVYQRHNLNIPGIPNGSCSNIFEDFFDHAFLINDALWDRFFCSSVSDMPQNAGGSIKKAQDTLKEFFYGANPLPVSRYKLASTEINRDEAVQKIMAEDGWKEIARYLVIDGGFNINSTSVDAWQATLQGLQNRHLVAHKNGYLKAFGNRDFSNDPPRNRNVFFSRFGTSTTDKSIDSIGGYNPITGANFRNSSSGVTAWGEVRELSPDQIRQLAEEIVKVVKERGPFLNMADFINRRLDSGNTEDASLTGALQAAIDNTQINTSIFNVNTSTSPGGELFSFANADQGSLHTAAPGYLIQSDVLASLGNVLTVRDDTFTVRSYGSVRDKRGRVLSQAWCEAIVQRCAEYVDSANDPTDAAAEIPGSAKRGQQLTSVNQAFGRRFKVISFKWLSAADV